MSPIRKIKARFNCYNSFNETEIPEADFYQFILDPLDVKNEIEKCGFKIIMQRSLDATKGVKDEIAMIQPLLQKAYDSHNVFGKAARFILSTLFSKIAGHIILQVFRKEDIG